MSLYVNTNVSSLNAQRQLMTSGNGLNTAFERLSSGFRINSASDDAAGLQITNRQTSQINGLNQAVRNANDGISLAQVAEGALQETGNMLQRMRELVVQADNGINEDEDLIAIQEEITQLQAEIDRVAGTTEFSGKNVLDGELDVGFLVGSRGTSEERITVQLSADGSGTTVAFDSSGLGIDDSVIDVTGLGSGAAPVQAALSAIDSAIATVGSARAELGAIQNRFQSTIANLSNVVENVSAARSRIQDTDFAAETANLTKFQITQQASTAILAQANQRPQAALSLL
ncbi:flagellin [Aliidiomarina maris]|uniref:Flagellin n=1 Tax=Aliidiomarina maris TaxID=531312 RepID=A0A327XAN9_9GAMM|nr:flagellin [Aliidiomarina maris]RAK00737.1 flagellin [Aliidiomarina maris]RUO27263.1 flagellin FliC [Aliidiomarina maris]